MAFLYAPDTVDPNPIGTWGAQGGGPIKHTFQISG